MDNRELNLTALDSCLENLKHLFIDIRRLEREPKYEEKRGGYADVHVSTLDPGIPASKLVAVKTIYLRGRHKEPQRLAIRLARELKVWAGLQHPHILPLLGYYLDEDYKIAVLISEYMVYGDLKDYIEQEKPSWDLRLRLIRDSTDGLAYLHGQSPPIRHGDLKTGNVLVNSERRAMLADFGLSKALEEGGSGLTTSDGLKGTVRYYSPELIMDPEAGNCLATDIWAWACLNLEVLADRVPYASKIAEHAIFSALLKGELPSDIESLPIPIQDLKLLLAKCWSLEPGRRPLALDCLSVINSALLLSKDSNHIERTKAQDDSLQQDVQYGHTSDVDKSTKRRWSWTNSESPSTSLKANYRRGFGRRTEMLPPPEVPVQPPLQQQPFVLDDWVDFTTFMQEVGNGTPPMIDSPWVGISPKPMGISPKPTGISPVYVGISPLSMGATPLLGEGADETWHSVAGPLSGSPANSSDIFSSPAHVPSVGPSPRPQQWHELPLFTGPSPPVNPKTFTPVTSGAPNLSQESVASLSTSGDVYHGHRKDPFSSSSAAPFPYIGLSSTRPTGYRRHFRPSDLTPLDAPTQKRNYAVPSVTSRKDFPPSVTKSLTSPSPRGSKRSSATAGLPTRDDAEQADRGGGSSGSDNADTDELRLRHSILTG